MVPATVSMLTRRFDLFEPVHLFAVPYAVMFVIRPAYDLATPGGLPSWFGWSMQGGYLQAQIIAALGAGMFYIGYYWIPSQPVAAAFPIPRFALSGRAVAWLTVIAASLSAVLFGVYVISVGGMSALGTLLLGRNVPYSPLSSVAIGPSWASTGYFSVAPLAITSLAILLLAILRRWKSPAGAAAIAILVASQVEAIGRGDRSWFLSALGSVVILWYLRRRQRPALMAAAIAVPLIFVFGITLPREYRAVSSTEPPSVTEIVQSALLDQKQNLDVFFTSTETGMVDDLALEVEAVPSEIPYALGSTYAGDATRPIPRPLWPDKPREEDVALTAVIFPTLAQVTVFTFSIFGEPFLNFSYIGVAFILAVYGVISRAFYIWFRSAEEVPAVQAIYATSLPFMALYMVLGVGSSYHRQAIFLAPMLVIIVLAQRRQLSLSSLAPDRDKATSTQRSFPTHYAQKSF